MNLEFLDQSRRYFKFAVDNDRKFYYAGIKAESGEIWFPRPDPDNWDKIIFESAKDCQFWAERVMNFKSMERIDKRLYNIESKALEMSDTDWKLIKSYMKRPDRFDPEKDVAIYEAHLANNFMDRDTERFSKGILNSFNKTIVGKNKLIGHDWGKPGEGVFYKARIEKMSVTDVIKIVGDSIPIKNFKKHLEWVAEKDEAILWLVPTYYMLNVTDRQKEAVINIDGGVWRDMSIGFKAPELWAIYDDETEEKVEQGFFGPSGVSDDKNVMFFEYRNGKNSEAEALEGSHVFLGAQYGAQTTKDSNWKSNSELQNEITKLRGKIQELEENNNISLNPSSKGEIKAEWTTAYINTLEDNCFAVVEPGLDKDDDGKTVPRTARHLPHHAKGNGATGTGGTVDLPHLRNALARMNQVKPVTENISVESLRSKAKRHLVAHAKKLGIGDYEQDQVNLNQENIMANIKIEGLNINMTVSDGDEFEASLKKAEDTINQALTSEFERLDQEISDTKQGRDDAVDAMNEATEKLQKSVDFEKSVKDVFGENSTIEDMKKAKATADAYVEDLVSKTVNLGVQIEMIDNEKVEERKEFLSKLSIEEIKVWLEQYQKIHDERNPRQPILGDNLDDKNPIDPDGKPKQKENVATDRAFTEPIQ